MVAAVLSQSIPSASASLIDSFSGGYNEASSGVSFTFSEGSAVNYSPTQTDGGTYDPLTLDRRIIEFHRRRCHYDHGFYDEKLVVEVPSVTMPGVFDTVTFDFETPTATAYSMVVGPFTLYFGIVEAPINSVAVSGLDGASAGTLSADYSAFIADGGNLGLTYNGLSLTSGGASLPAAPSASFTLVANGAPEPSSAILGLSGAVAIMLGKTGTPVA